MNTPSNAVPGSPLESQGTAAQSVAPAAVSATRPMYWSLRRELWENRSIYIAPLAAAAVFLFGFMLSLIGLPHKMRAALALDPAHAARSDSHAVRHRGGPNDDHRNSCKCVLLS